MSEVFTVNRRVEFCETDAAQIAHFSEFFLYMEQAEHALLRHVGLAVFMQDDLGEISWPRAAASCNYTGAVRFEEELTIDVSISRIGEKSVTYQFHFTAGERDVARGEITTVCCRIDPNRPPQPVPIPPFALDKLRPHLRRVSSD